MQLASCRPALSSDHIITKPGHFPVLLEAWLKAPSMMAEKPLGLHPAAIKPAAVNFVLLNQSVRTG
jgi:hypothetical protein